MFVAILILLILPFTDTSNIKGSNYKPLFIFAFWIFAFNFLVLMWLGSCHVEPPFIIAGQIATVYYFLHFLFIIPLFGIIDNILSIIGINWKATSYLMTNNPLTHTTIKKINNKNKKNIENNKAEDKREEKLHDFLSNSKTQTNWMLG